MAFNLTAQLNLQGPTNVKQIASQIKKDLGNITSSVTFKIDPAATKNVAALSSSLQALNATFGSTVVSANAAAQAIKAFGSSINSVKANNLSQQLNASTSAITNVSKSASKSSKDIGAIANEMQEFGKQAALAVRRFTAFSTVTSVIYGLTNSVSNGVQAFIDYDKELVKLQQVTGESAQGLGKLQSQISSLATAYGVSSKELTNVASTLAQAGLSARDTEKALKALALSSLAPSFDSMNETVEGSIALMRQFGIGAEDLEGSLGSINKVAAQFAVESSDIITAIQRTGSVFATASKGVSEGKDALNEFIAVFTSVRATTRESAETIATGLRTIFTRIQRGDTINALKDFGVNLTDAQGKFVGAYKAVELLSKGLGGIDPRSLDFSKIIEELGGFRQIGKVIPLIQQFGVAQEALKVAQRGQGSLAKDAATAQLSLANQISKVREEFFALFREIGSSKGFQTLVRGALDLTSGLIKVAGAVKGLLPVLSILVAFKGIKALTEFTSGFATGIKRGPDNKSGSDNKPFFNSGGVVRKFARGGVVPGSGSGDTVPAMLEPGEFVIRKKAVETIGSNNLHNMNKYGTGGSIIAGRSGRRKKFAKGGAAEIASIDGNQEATDGDTFTATVTPTGKPFTASFRIADFDTYEIGKKASRVSEAKAVNLLDIPKNKNKIKPKQGRSGFVIPSDYYVSDDMTASTAAEKGTKALQTQIADFKDTSKIKIGGGFGRYLVSGFTMDSSLTTGRTWNESGKLELARGGKIQKFAGGGQVLRNIGIIDTDVLRDAANATVVRPAMEKLGVTDVSEYTTKLGELAAKARKNKSLSKFTAIAGAAGSGKSSIATGKGANDNASLRKTTRSQILTPEDIDKVNEVFILTSTASQTKLDSYLKDVDRAYILSSNNKDEQDQIRSNRDRRDDTGEGLYGRKPGTTRGAITDFALEETVLRDELGKKATVLGRKKDSFGLRRKKDSELPEIIQAGGFYTGGFAPPTRGHRGALDALLDNMLSKNPKASLEDIVVSIAPDLPMIAGKEGIDHAARYGIFPADFRALLSKTNFGNAMISTQDQPAGGLPKFMEVAGSGERRRFARLKGAMAITSGKEEGVLGKYGRAGMDVKDIPRIEDISATKVRDALFSGDDKTLTSFLNPEVASILMGNRAQLRNRSTMVPMLIKEIQKFVNQDKARSNAEISELLASAPGGPYGNVNANLKQNAPEIAGKIQDIRSQRDRASRGAFGYRAFNIIRALSAKYPDMYGLDPSRKASISAQPSDLTKDAISAQLSEGMSGEFGGVSTAMPSGLEEAILKNVEKATQVKKSSGILPAQGSEILKRFGAERLPNDPSFGPFSGKKVADTADGGKLKYWQTSLPPATNPEKQAYYFATRDYLIDKFNQSQGTQKATSLAETTSAVLSSKQLGLVGLNPLGYTGLLGPETWNLGIDSSGQERSIDASIVQRGLPNQYQNVIDYLSGKTEEIVGGASKLLGITPKKLSKKQRETLGQGNIEGALLEQIFGSADATILDDALRTRPIDFPMGIGAKASKIFGIDPDIPTEVKRTIDSGSRGKAVEEFQRYFRQQYGIPDPEKEVVKLAGGGLLKKYGEIFPNNNSTGPFKEMVFDFDDTLVTGGEIRLPDGGLDLSRKDDMPLVQEMLKKGKLTPLGQHLSDVLRQEPSLIDNVSILSARNPNQAGILAQTLQNLGLPIPASKIRGSNGPQNKKITGYQKMIDDNLETITRLKSQGQEAIHYTFANGGKIEKVEDDYKSILKSILPKEMLTDDGYLKMASGQAEPISFIAPPDLATRSKNEMMAIILGKSQKVSNDTEDTGGAYYRGALKYKTLRHNLEKYKDKLPQEEYGALKTWVDQAIVFQGDDDDLIKTTGGTHKGVLAHETFHDIQGFLYDNHPEIIDKLHESLLKRKGDVAKWYADPANSEWTGRGQYKMEHFFPDVNSRSPYKTDLITEAFQKVKKKIKKEPAYDVLTVLGATQWDFGKNELIPVLLSAAAVRNKGATELLSQAFGDSGLNPDFYKTLPKFKLGGVIKDIWHGTTTGKDDSVLESFKKYGAKSDVSHGFGQGYGFYVYSDPTSAMVRAMELEGGANYLTAADPNGKPMALKFTELLNGKDWDLDYEFQNADIVNFIHSHYDRVKEAVAKSKGVDLGSNLKDFSLDQKYDEYLDTTDNMMMRKIGISFKDQGKDAQRLLANNNSGDARSGEVLSSLVKSIMHSDSDFYEEFENSFFSDLKPKQGLKYVGKNPLRPVLAKVFDKKKTEWETQQFAKGGSVEDTVPALLTPGEFVINKSAAKKIGYSKLNKLNHADKVRGYNKGGIVGGPVQTFAAGGTVNDLSTFLNHFFGSPSNKNPKIASRPDDLSTDSIKVMDDFNSSIRDMVTNLNDAGVSVKNLASILNKNGDLSYGLVARALEKDIERLKIVGAGADKIIIAERQLAETRNAGAENLAKRQFLEAGLKESKVGKTIGSGASQQSILNYAKIAEQKITELKIQSFANKLQMPGATQSQKQLIATQLANSDEEKARTKEKAMIFATKKVTGIRTSEMSSLGIGGDDIQKYIAESMRDRKTLSQMDKQLIADKIKEVKNTQSFGYLSFAEQKKMLDGVRKAAREEISIRRQIINELAAQKGQKGVGATDLIDFRNSPILNSLKARYSKPEGGLNFENVGTDIGAAAALITSQADNISKLITNTSTDQGRIQAATRGAAISSVGTTVSAGMALSGQLATIPGVGPYLAAFAAAGTAAYALADAFADVSGSQEAARREAEKALRLRDLETATIAVNNAFKNFEADLSNAGVQKELSSSISVATQKTDADVMASIEEAKLNKEKSRPYIDFNAFNPFATAADVGPSYLGAIGEEIATGRGAVINKSKLSKQEKENIVATQSEKYTDSGSKVLALYDQQIKTGKTVKDIISDVRNASVALPDALNNAAAFTFSSNPKALQEFNDEKDKASRLGRPTEEEILIIKKGIVERELENNTLLKSKETTKNLSDAMDAANRAGRKLAQGFERFFDVINSTMNSISFDIQDRISSSRNRASALRGAGELPDIQLKNINTLENPRADINRTLEVVSGIAKQLDLSDQNRQKFIGAAGIQLNLGDSLSKAITDELGKNANNLDVEGATDIVNKTIKNKVDELKLPPEFSAQIKDLLLKQVGVLSDKAEKENTGNPSTALSVFIDGVDDLIEKNKALGKEVFDTAKSFELLKQNTIIKEFGVNLREISKLQKEEIKIRQSIRELTLKTNIGIREATIGVGQTYEETRSSLLGQVSELTGGKFDANQNRVVGGETTVAGVNQLIKNLTKQRNNKFDELSIAKDQVNVDPNTINKLQSELQGFDTSLSNAKEAIDLLASSTELLEKAMNDLQRVTQLQEDRFKFAQKLVSNTPEESDKLNKTFIRLQRNLSGGFNTPYNQRDARKEFQETLYRTGNVRQATRAGNAALANQRKETLDLMNDPQYRAIQELQLRGQIEQNIKAGNKPVNAQGQEISVDEAVAQAFRNMETRVMTQMAIESGQINNPIVRQVIANRQNPNLDPARQAANDKIAEALGLRQEAQKTQADIIKDAVTELSTSNGRLAVSIDVLAANIGAAFIDDKNLNGKVAVVPNALPTQDLSVSITDMASVNATLATSINSLVEVLRGSKEVNAQNFEAPVTSIAGQTMVPLNLASKGGMIYAAEGQLVDFQPQGTDTVPAMLTPGEFVVNASATKQNLGLLQAINNGYSKGGKVSYFADGGLVQLFRGFDKNRDSVLTEDEFPRIKDFDTNKDGSITQKEFIAQSSMLLAKESYIKALKSPKYIKKYKELAKKDKDRTAAEEAEYKQYSDIISSKEKTQILHDEQIRQQQNSRRRMSLNIKGRDRRSPEEELEYQTLREEQRQLNPGLQQKQESIRRQSLMMLTPGQRQARGVEGEYQELRTKWDKEHPEQAKERDERTARNTKNGLADRAARDRVKIDKTLLEINQDRVHFLETKKKIAKENPKLSESELFKRTAVQLGATGGYGDPEGWWANRLDKSKTVDQLVKEGISEELINEYKTGKRQLSMLGTRRSIKDGSKLIPGSQSVVSKPSLELVAHGTGIIGPEYVQPKASNDIQDQLTGSLEEAVNDERSAKEARSKAIVEKVRREIANKSGSEMVLRTKDGKVISGNIYSFDPKSGSLVVGEGSMIDAARGQSKIINMKDLDSESAKSVLSIDKGFLQRKSSSYNDIVQLDKRSEAINRDTEARLQKKKAETEEAQKKLDKADQNLETFKRKTDLINKQNEEAKTNTIQRYREYYQNQANTQSTPQNAFIEDPNVSEIFYPESWTPEKRKDYDQKQQERNAKIIRDRKLRQVQAESNKRTEKQRDAIIRQNFADDTAKSDALIREANEPWNKGKSAATIIQGDKAREQRASEYRKEVRAGQQLRDSAVAAGADLYYTMTDAARFTTSFRETYGPVDEASNKRDWQAEIFNTKNNIRNTFDIMNDPNGPYKPLYDITGNLPVPGGFDRATRTADTFKTKRERDKKLGINQPKPIKTERKATKAQKKSFGGLIYAATGGEINPPTGFFSQDQLNRGQQTLNQANNNAAMSQATDPAGIDRRSQEAMIDDGSLATELMRGITRNAANAREQRRAYEDSVIAQGQGASAFSLGAAEGGTQLGVTAAATYGTAALLAPTPAAPFIPIVAPFVGGLAGMGARAATEFAYGATGTTESVENIRSSAPGAYFAGSVLPAAAAIGSQGLNAVRGSLADRFTGSAINVGIDAATQFATQGSVDNYTGLATSAVTGFAMPGMGAYEETAALRQMGRREIGGVIGGQFGRSLQFNEADAARAAASIETQFASSVIGEQPLFSGTSGTWFEQSGASPRATGNLGMTEAISTSEIADPTIRGFASMSADLDPSRSADFVPGHGGRNYYADTEASLPLHYARQSFINTGNKGAVLVHQNVPSQAIANAPNMFEPNPTLTASMSEALLSGESPTIFAHSNRSAPSDVATPSDVVNTYVQKHFSRKASPSSSDFGESARRQMAEDALINASPVMTSLSHGQIDPRFKEISGTAIAVSDPSILGGFTAVDIMRASEVRPSSITFNHAVGHTSNEHIGHTLLHDDKEKHKNNYRSSGGLIYANNGAFIGAASGTDTVPAMLTPGEFVINREASQKHMPLLDAINSGHFNRGGIVNYLANGGIVAPKYYAGGGEAALRTGGVHNSGANMSGSADALNAGFSQFNEAVASMQESINKYNEISQTMNQSMNQFSESTQTFRSSTESYGLSVSDMPRTLDANVNAVVQTHHTGLGEVGERIVQDSSARAQSTSRHIAQNTVNQYDRTAFDGGMNSSANNRPMGGNYA
jgi:TP901 family phage tail tape measure protein